VYLTSLVSNSDNKASNERMISECQIGKDVKGKGSGLIEGNIQTFAWTDWGKPQNSVKIFGLQAGIWPRGLPNTMQNCQKIDHDVRYEWKIFIYQDLCTPASSPMGTRGVYSPGGKVQPGSDADHSPPSNAEVEIKIHEFLSPS
jgi:hypothetical protein